jgi:hypothetical protein
MRRPTPATSRPPPSRATIGASKPVRGSSLRAAVASGAVDDVVAGAAVVVLELVELELELVELLELAALLDVLVPAGRSGFCVSVGALLPLLCDDVEGFGFAVVPDWLPDDEPLLLSEPANGSWYWSSPAPPWAWATAGTPATTAQASRGTSRLETRIGTAP